MIGKTIRDERAAPAEDPMYADNQITSNKPAAPERDVLDTTAAGGLILRGSAMRFASYVAVVALSAVSTALLTRHLGVATFGQYTTVISLVSVISVVTDAGMSNLGTREYAVQSGSDRDKLLQELLSLRIALTSVGVFLAAMFAVAAGFSPALLAGTLLAGIATVALVLQHTLSIPLSAMLRMGPISMLELARQALSVVLIVTLVLVGAGVLPLLAVTLIVNLALIPLTAVFVRGQITLGVSLRPRHWVSLMRLTVYFSLATAVGTVYVYAAQILTSLVASPHQSGLFAVSFRVFIVAAAVPGMLVGTALPMLARAARDDQQRLAYALRRIFEVSLIIGVAAALTTFAGARFVIEVIANQEYAGAASVLQIQGIAMIASFVTAGWAFALISTKRYKGLLIANAGALVVSCTLTPLLARTNGANGAAIATLCGEATLALGSLVALTRGQPELRPPFAIVVKVLIAVIPAAALASSTVVPPLPLTLLSVSIYGLLILLLRAVPREVIDLLPGRRVLAR